MMDIMPIEEFKRTLNSVTLSSCSLRWLHENRGGNLPEDLWAADVYVEYHMYVREKLLEHGKPVLASKIPSYKPFPLCYKTEDDSLPKGEYLWADPAHQSNIWVLIGTA
jgi:hypothetical protein